VGSKCPSRAQVPRVCPSIFFAPLSIYFDFDLLDLPQIYRYVFGLYQICPAFVMMIMIVIIEGDNEDVVHRRAFAVTSNDFPVPLVHEFCAEIGIAAHIAYLTCDKKSNTRK